MREITVAIASTASLPAAVDQNLAQITGFARQAAQSGCDLLLTPEMSASGYGGYPEVMATAERVGRGPVYEGLACAATETGVVVCAGFVEAMEERRFISHYVVWPGGRYVVQRKHRVTPRERPLSPYYKLHPEEDPGEPGQPETVAMEDFEIGGVRCAIFICADEGLQQRLALLAERKVDLMLLPVGAGGLRKDRFCTADLATDTGRRQYYRMLESVFFPGESILECLETGRAIAAVNLVGHDGRDHYHIGHGSIVNRWGEIPGFFHGIPNLDRQRPMFAHARLDFQ